MKAIVNGKIILEDRIVENTALVFSDVIEGLVPLNRLPDGAEIIDAGGGFAAPGLIDLHIHGYLGCDVCDGEEQSLRTIAKGLLANGVTGFLPTTTTADMRVLRRALEVCRKLKEQSRSWCGSTILGCHAEGPFINQLKKGAQAAAHILKPNADFVLKFSDIISIITLAPETDTEDFAAIREICKKTDVAVSMGHTAADYDTAIRAVDAGVCHATHLFNAMSPLGHRAPGAAGAALNSDVSCELIVDTHHVHPSLFGPLWKIKGRRLCFVTDCLPAGGLKEGEYTLGGQKIISDGSLCRLEDGTLAGSVLKLNRGVINVCENSDIPLYECVNCASLNPATVLGIADKKGSIQTGKDADIIITDPAFNVEKTIIGGEIRYEA